MAVRRRALSLLCLPLALVLPLTLQRVSAEEAVMSATFEGKPWTASFTLAQTMQMGGKPMLNLSGTEQGSPTMTFNSMLELKDPNDLAGAYPLKTGSPANSANFNVLNSGAMVGHIRFSSGKIVIDKYDAAAKTISGHFSASGKDESGKPEEVTDGKFSGIPVTAQ
ncbi:DUF6252 family protein [Mesorhizobium sp. M2A.F.Ca.ET.039.01.1.1]|uniref:DUF6252 family protein n=1 Tax=Mesorhizobium sp. M2A.F.Ca.ET.039.01.1.1 TaxID=2496746 RepID=UPI000FCCB921|nr:DUF6252 family protein [Mesorhizobium sp. M2A.F.Ca.ET.039.01.1.1]RWX58941.1 hypothetical protein EOA24_37560 [Mesorhizobium sp. M2A.F.Ca.ET.039.01.1.1]TIV40755.1 MAG: hypothetical protein E5V99_02790 [Mesorhizobium sp.]